MRPFFGLRHSKNVAKMLFFFFFKSTQTLGKCPLWVKFRHLMFSLEATFILEITLCESQ